MAKAPAHKFGQIVGQVLEAGVQSPLQTAADKYGLYLDKRSRRPARQGKAVRWKDLYGNTHQLDFVLERGGTPSETGAPVAFVEAAYRRYTKHSRNKVQEIQGAIIPLVQTYQTYAPFMGAVLAGVFTRDSIAQLKSLGFAVLYFPYDSVNQAFLSVGIESDFDESTSDSELQRKITAWDALPQDKYERVGNELMRLNASEAATFIAALERSISRRIELIRILPLHGETTEYSLISDAIQFVRTYVGSTYVPHLVRYEIEIRYTTGDRILGQFADKASAIHFLSQYSSV